MKLRKSSFAIASGILFSICGPALADPPPTFDLRDVGGENYVTSVKNQSGGTCWTFGAMAAVEGNLLMTGAWEAAGEPGEPDLAEYHLDWWNGFNQHNNDDTDPPTGGGLVVHQGGDYRVTSAYLTRGEGAVRNIDGQSYSSPPLRWDPSYHLYYVRNIEWYIAGADLSNINLIKEKIMAEGVMGTCMCYSTGFMSGNIHYQPPGSTALPNHAIAIVGWDDNKTTQAPQGAGAWLCKNSWGTGWGDGGYFWISYYDKWSCQEPQMGAVSLQDVEPLAYDHIYYHDYHGWRDTKSDSSRAFNAFVAAADELLKAVSFFSAADNVTYTVTVYDRFEAGVLLDVLATQTGLIEYTGFRTVDLDTPVVLTTGNDFYIELELSAGGQPYDCTSDVPVLLGASYRVIVESSASPGESYYWDGAVWQDMQGFDETANFCIKGLAVEYSVLEILFPDGRPEALAPGTFSSFVVEIRDMGEEYVPGSGLLHYRYDGGDFLTAPLTPIGDDLYEATLPPAGCADQPEYYLSAEGGGRTVVFSPADAPSSVYAASVGTYVTIAHDDFETDLGWIAGNLGATSGWWQRGVPVDDPGWEYDPYSDSDGSGQCYLTQNEVGNTDVDDGAVRLHSPMIDVSSGNIAISYDYYLYLTDSDGADRLLVEINDGQSGTWTEIARHDTGGGLAWWHHEITQADLDAAGVTLTENMQLRFTVNDADAQSIVEAGIDAFHVAAFVCTGGVRGDVNCDGVVDFADINPFVAVLTGATPCFFDNADVNGDGSIDFGDINPFVALLD